MPTYAQSRTHPTQLRPHQISNLCALLTSLFTMQVLALQMHLHTGSRAQPSVSNSMNGGLKKHPKMFTHQTPDTAMQGLDSV